MNISKMAESEGPINTKITLFSNAVDFYEESINNANIAYMLTKTLLPLSSTAFQCHIRSQSIILTSSFCYTFTVSTVWAPQVVFL